MFFIILATDKAGMEAVRLRTRPAHRAYLRDPGAHGVKVLLGGPTMTVDNTEMNGTLLVVEAPTLEAVSSFVADDPYSRERLFVSIEIRPWAWSLGAPEVGP